MDNDSIAWLLAGDVSIQYQVHRDLLGHEKPELRKRIETEGWGAQFLACRKPNGHWGRSYYQPKWTSTHYTLLDLKSLGISPEHPVIAETLRNIFLHEKGPDGGINPSPNIPQSDVCLNGMFLNFACYFHANVSDLVSVVDFLLSTEMKDGGFNCQSNRKGATHSSLHSTLSVLEGICEYERNGYHYRLAELQQAKLASQAFVLMHKLFRSDRTGAIIDPNFLRLHYPGRWHYDILKAMDYFQQARVPYDPRMDEAIGIILSKKTKDGWWKLAARYPGAVHFEMEEAGAPSRWNTLRALRVLKYYAR